MDVRKSFNEHPASIILHEAEVEAPEETAADLSPEDLVGEADVEETEDVVVLDEEEDAEETSTPDEE